MMNSGSARGNCLRQSGIMKCSIPRVKADPLPAKRHKTAALPVVYDADTDDEQWLSSRQNSSQLSVEHLECLTCLFAASFSDISPRSVRPSIYKHLRAKYYSNNNKPARDKGQLMIQDRCTSKAECHRKLNKLTDEMRDFKSIRDLLTQCLEREKIK